MRFFNAFKSWALLVKKTTLYAERDEEKRQTFLTEIKALNPEEIIFLDESGIDSSLCREHGRSFRGKQVKSDISGKRSERTSIISGWLHTSKEFIAPYVFNGYTDGTRFNKWLEECLLPKMTPGQTLVMDNASFHKGKNTKEIINRG